MNAAQCQAACLADSSCGWAALKEKMCSGFSWCGANDPVSENLPGSGFQTWKKVKNVAFERSTMGIRVAAAFADGIANGWADLLSVTLVNEGTAPFNHPLTVKVYF